MLTTLVSSLANNALSIFKSNLPRQHKQPLAASMDIQESGDLIEISQEARMRQEVLNLLAQVATRSSRLAGSNYKTLPEVRQDFLADLAGLKMDLVTLLQAARIDMKNPIALQPDGKGHILVMNDHPQADKINSIFADNPALVSRFMVMAARGALTQAAEIDPDFKTAYEQNPPAAIRAHIGLLKELLLGFRLQIENREAAVEFPLAAEIAAENQ